MINIDRNSVDAPKIVDKYDTIEVRKALQTLFMGKCYLCENFSPNSFKIDHFIPQNEDKDKILDWNNLFLSCDDCNSMRPRKIPANGWLNPCNPEDDVEKDIKYKVEKVTHKPIFIASKDEQKIKNTIHLLERLHYGHDPKTVFRTSSLREAIKDRAIELKDAMLDYFKKDDFEEKQLQQKTIKNVVSKRSPFTMLMRSVALEYGFSDLFD